MVTVTVTHTYITHTHRRALLHNTQKPPELATPRDSWHYNSSDGEGPFDLDSPVEQVLDQHCSDDYLEPDCDSCRSEAENGLDLVDELDFGYGEGSGDDSDDQNGRFDYEDVTEYGCD